MNHIRLFLNKTDKHLKLDQKLTTANIHFYLDKTTEQTKICINGYQYSGINSVLKVVKQLTKRNK